MGFYGNITNTSRTQFQFDKTYPSRRTMEESMNGDGVFVGRYVLVEYDSNVTHIYKQQLYRKDDEYYGDNNQFYYLYTSINLEHRVQYRAAVDGDTSINYGVNGNLDAYKGAIAYVIEPGNFTTFYQCVGRDGTDAVFQALDNNSNYVFNYNQDKVWATAKGYTDIGRGWDSTVWQKTYSNGIEKYVMIAELNSVVPTFDIGADAPSISPITPHFDENSTNIYYKLHWQPQWGVRIKGAYNDLKGAVLEDSGEEKGFEDKILLRSNDDNVSYPSDMSINWNKQEYDKQDGKYHYYAFGLLNNNNHNGTWVDLGASPSNETLTKIQKGFPGAIYFNKDGFDPQNIVKSTDLFDNNRLEKFNYVSNLKRASENGPLKDEILLSPTGLSGHKYNQHTGEEFSQKPAVDTYEFSMMIPSLGDTISDIWDLIYGGRSTSDEINISNSRNLDIEWEDAAEGQEKAGLRLVHLKNGEFSYDTKQVNTLAGCINTAHDIMGMIIQDTHLGTDVIDFNNQETLNNLSLNNIYYYGKAYYRKRKFYDYKAPTQNETLKEYEKVDLIKFENNTYYEKILSNFLLLDSAPEENRTVYTLISQPETIQFTNNYKPNKFYQKIDIGSGNYSYKLDTNPVQDDTKTYVALHNYDNNGNYVETRDNNGNINSAPVEHHLFFYYPGVFYYFEDNVVPSETAIPIGPDTNDRTSGRIYYYKTTEDVIEDGVIKHIDKYNRIPDEEMADFEAHKYYTFSNDTYHAVTSNPTYNNNNLKLGVYYTLPYLDAHPDQINFYQSGLYYYKNEGNYLLDTAKTFTSGRTYYKINIANTFNALLNKTFYEKKKYYVTDNDQTEPLSSDLPSDAEFNSNKTYWKKLNYYVASDSNNIYAVGMKWDKTVQVPTGVTLCNRTERWGVEELEGFTEKINTMLGLMLRIRAMLDEGNSDTRDPKTVQGSINLLNDIIAKFGARKVGDVMITNNYGQVAGARQTTSQPYQYTNHGLDSNATSTATDTAEDQWIYWDVDSTYTDPVITLKHRLVSEMDHAVNPTTTTSDKNNDSSVTGTGLNKTHGDTLKLYTPIVDSAGHVVGNNTETVTLPYGFKILKSLAQSSDDSIWSTTAGVETEIIADNTQDTLSFATGNKWIRIVPDATNDKVTFAHESHTVTPTTSTATLNGRTANSVSFSIPTYSFDNANHYNGLDTKTYTLNMPYVFKTINVTNSLTTVTDAASTIKAGGQSADTIEDTLTLSASNKWIKLDNDTEDTIKFGHLVGTISTSTSAPSLSSTSTETTTFSVPTYEYDEAGHITSKATATYTMPNSFGKISGDTGSAEADCTHDILTITGDTWVSVIASDTSNTDALSITHKDPVVTTLSANNVTPNFGSTFTIEDWSFDSKGHKNGSTTHTVTIPQGSLTDATANEADVITQLSFTASTGALSTTRTNIGNLKLTGYTLGDSSTTIAATDTLNTALGKLQKQSTALASLVNTLNANDETTGSVDYKIKTEINKLDATISQTGIADNGNLNLSITETDGKITSISGSIPSETYDAYGAASTVYNTLLGSITDNGSANTICGAKAYVDSLINGYRVPSCTENIPGTYVLECTVTQSGTDLIYAYNWVPKS